jgi:hypothetical protein
VEAEASCPCADMVGSASELNDIFEGLIGEAEIDTNCVSAGTTRVDRRIRLGPPEPVLLVAAGLNSPPVVGPYCRYGVGIPNAPDIESGILSITEAQLEACREDIRSLMDRLACR